MSLSRLPTESGDHPLIGTWEQKSRRRSRIQDRLLFVAAIAEREGVDVRLCRTDDGFDVIVRCE